LPGGFAALLCKTTEKTGFFSAKLFADFALTPSSLMAGVLFG
jgi:hypothetical protein